MTESLSRRRPSDLPSGRRTKFVVLVFWLGLAAVAGPLALQLTEVQDNDALAALPASTEAGAAAARAEAAFDGSDRLVAVAVYAREAGLTGADRAAVEADRTALARFAEGGQVPPPAASGDGQALLLSFPLAGDEAAQADATAAIRDQLAAGVPDGLQTALTGSAGAADDVFDAFEGMDVTLLAVTGSVVVLLLLLTYRSPVLWLIPLVSVALASQAASAAVYLLARHAGVTVDFQSQSVLTVLVFGVGVDYALLLIARYREELTRYPDRHRAMAVALRRSFPAILASAATVAAGLLCLLAAQLPATRGLGPVAAVGIAAAFVAMTTLLPALLVLCGRWVFWPFVPRYAPGAAAAQAGQAAESGHRGWARLARVVGRRPRPVWIGTAVALGVLALGIGNLSIGLSDEDLFTTEVGSVTGQKLVGAHFPGGAAAPAEILATAAAADRVVAAARAVDGVAEVADPVVRSADGQWVRVDAVLADPPDSDLATGTVQRLRAAVHAVPGADALVGGQTAIALDTERVADRDNRLVMPLILGVVLLVLVGLLRALVAPLLLMASVVLSYLAALGAAGLIFQAAGLPGLFYALPLQAFIFLVALGVDYTIFLVTRAREETDRIGHRPGVLRALTVTGGVITSAGLVLAATFASLSVLPLTPSVQIGIIVAVGVLLDTFLVRSLLIPALAVHVGRRFWWPGRLARAGAPASAPVLSGSLR
ncbi:MAG: MMPL family transporter [Micromonosporaceae bacterium]|nr:MMPL family transporter [Micromonosporaceae bacterium]